MLKIPSPSPCKDQHSCPAGWQCGSTWHFCPAQPQMQHLLQSITDPEGPHSPWAAWQDAGSHQQCIRG